MKGAPWASIDTSLVAEGTTDVKYSDLTFTFNFILSQLINVNFNIQFNLKKKKYIYIYILRMLTSSLV